jgi:hypothetical protein
MWMEDHAQDTGGSDREGFFIPMDPIITGIIIQFTCPDRPWGPANLLYNGYRVFPGGRKRPGRDTDPSPLLVPRSKDRVELYL